MTFKPSDIGRPSGIIRQSSIYLFNKLSIFGSFVDWFRRTAFDLPGRTKSWADEELFSEVWIEGFVFSDWFWLTEDIDEDIEEEEFFSTGVVIAFGSQAKEVY